MPESNLANFGHLPGCWRHEDGGWTCNPACPLKSPPDRSYAIRFTNVELDAIYHAIENAPSDAERERTYEDIIDKIVPPIGGPASAGSAASS